MRRSLQAVSACAVLAWSATAAGAQDLPRIHITALGMHADRPVVATGESYHVTIHVHVNERRDRLDELVLPGLGNATDLGDERRRVAGAAGGTDFYEIMTVSSPDTGTASFTPAYVDAIDPATNRAMRYSSQLLTVRVTSGAATPEPFDRVTRSVERTLRDALLIGALALCAVAVALVIGLRRRRRLQAVPPAPPAAIARPLLAPLDSLPGAIAAFRTRRDDPTLDALRNLLFARAGARPGATLTDALHAVGARDPALVHAMATAERVRFGPSGERDAAARDLFDALDLLVPGGPARV